MANGSNEPNNNNLDLARNILTDFFHLIFNAAQKGIVITITSISGSILLFSTIKPILFPQKECFNTDLVLIIASVFFGTGLN